MKRFLAFVALCSVYASLSFAQTSADAPASKEDVENYLQAVHSHEMMKQMVVAMAKPMHQVAHDQCAKNAERLPADCESRMNKVMDDMMAEFPFDQLIDAMVPTYEKHFTKGEMAALTAFYSAPVGQKILKEMPGVMSEAMETMMPMMRQSVDHMTERLQDQVAQMGKQPAPAKN